MEDNILESAGGGYILTDGTTVALENVEATSQAFAGHFKDDPDSLAKTLCNCALEIHEAGLPGMVKDYIDCALAAGGSDEVTARAIVELGAGLERAEDLKSAIEAYSRAMHLPQRDPFTWYFLHNNLGYCLGQLGRFDEAFPLCLTAIRIDPERHNAFKNLGIALQGLGRFEETAGCYRQAYMLNNEDGRARRHLADLLFEGDIGKIPDLGAQERLFRVAVSRISNMIGEGGGSAEGERVPLENFDGMYLALAESFGDMSACICMGLGMLAWQYEMNGKPLDMDRVFERITAAGSPAQAAQALLRVADNLAEHGHPQAALEYFARTEELIPEEDHFLTMTYHSRMGWRLVGLGRHGEAERHFREAIRLNPWEAKTHRGLAIALLAQGDPSAAEREILAADALTSESRQRLTGAQS